MDEPAPSLQELIEQKQRIAGGIESSGEGDARTQARRFERERLRPALIAHAVARQREQGQDPGEHDLLISLSGFSPATSLFAFELLGRPRKVLLICSCTSLRSWISISPVAVCPSSSTVPDRWNVPLGRVRRSSTSAPVSPGCGR